MAGWKVSVDTGGTFTDCIAVDPEGNEHRLKILSSSRLKFEAKCDGSFDTISIKTDQKFCEDFFKGYQLKHGNVKSAKILSYDAKQKTIRLSDAIQWEEDQQIVEIISPEEAPIFGLRCLLGRCLDEKLPEVQFRLGTTRGTNALLENKGAKVLLITSKGFGDITKIGNQRRLDLFALEIVKRESTEAKTLEIDGIISASGEEISPLRCDRLEKELKRAKEDGIKVITIALKNSYANPCHELELKERVKKLGFETIILSHEVSPFIHYLRRIESSVVNGTLSPILNSYLDAVEEPLGKNHLRVMTSAGALISRSRFRPIDSLLSGPAGGVVGAVATGKALGWNQILTLDMGGTSTDVARYTNKSLMVNRLTVGNATVSVPSLKLETVAAGGGSICGFNGDRLFVGPESAGANPGPACYGANGPLTLTDVNLLLGRLDPNAFSIPISIEAARIRLNAVAKSAGESDPLLVAEGFVRIADQRMAQAMRAISLRDGENPRDYGLVSFGGAGGLHACSIGEILGINSIAYPRNAGVLSADGIAHSALESVQEIQFIHRLDQIEGDLKEEINRLSGWGRDALLSDGLKTSEIIKGEQVVYLRLQGQEAAIAIDYEFDESLAPKFKKQFESQFGYYPIDAVIETVSLRVRISGKSQDLPVDEFSDSVSEHETKVEQLVFIDGNEKKVPVCSRCELLFDSILRGPAILKDELSAFFLKEGWVARISKKGNLKIDFEGEKQISSKAQSSIVNQELVFSSLESLVTEMGVQLERTAISPNIRERLDFSCALLDAKANLLVNAPHVPVHLGAMGVCVREIIGEFEFSPGDVLITNHPGKGGSHLPDISLVKALFDQKGNLIAYLCNRAHHAELGGSRPGSMPPDARNLMEEGVVISPQWLIKDKNPRFSEIRTLLSTGQFPSRAVDENISDLQAQIASLSRGESLWRELLMKYKSEELSERLGELYQLGEESIIRHLNTLPDKKYQAIDTLDDGTRISLIITKYKDRLHFDFSGTDPKHKGNFNATPAIVQSAILYCIRVWIDEPIPLNEGILSRVEITLPNCFLNPEFSQNLQKCPAVVGGNVETSQRIVDVVFSALELIANGQGTMNNFLFGNDEFGYYETIGGGSGAGNGFDGASGIHVHMTNTAITDSEILESKFPIRLKQFNLRKSSGGKGKWKGGDGLIREFQFLEPLQISLLTQRRKTAPKGMAGGESGACGEQLLIKANGSKTVLSGIDAVDVEAGDCITIKTPGGGGYGSVK